MPYHPTTSKYSGKTKTYYVIYKQTFKAKTRSGTTYPRTQTRVKRVYISGTLVNTRTGTFKNRLGKSVYGVLFTYKTRVKGFTAQRGRTRYRQPSKTIVVKKIVELPRNAKNIRVSSRAPKGALMDID